MASHLQEVWWGLAFRGFILIIAGVIALIIPDILILVFLYVFAFFAFAGGVMLIIEGFRIRDKTDKIIRIIEGVFYIIIGIVTFAAPASSLAVLMIIIACWAIIIGIFQITAAFKLRKSIRNEWIGILNGLITLIFGILILTDVFTSATALMMLFGAFAIISGLFSVVLSFRIKNYKFGEVIDNR